MSSHAWLAALVAGVVASWPSPGFGQGPEPAVVWYRGAEGCPGPEEFLHLLGELSPRARVAQAGDRVDFVVTFTATEAGVAGRVERQTTSGTVAIRELVDERCPTVAGALALGLQLALQSANADAPGDLSGAASTGAGPDGANAQPPAEPAAAPAMASTGPEAAPTGEGIATEPVTPATSGSSATGAPPPRAASNVRWSLAGAAGLGTEQLSAPSLFAQVLLDVHRAPSGPALRGGVVGGHGVRRAELGDVEHTLLAARLDGCPARVVADRVELWLCLGGELGRVRAVGRASTGVAAGGTWLAATGELSLRWRATRWLGLQANAGAVVPVTRFAVHTSEGELYRTAPDGVRLSAGPFFGAP